MRDFDVDNFEDMDHESDDNVITKDEFIVPKAVYHDEDVVTSGGSFIISDHTNGEVASVHSYVTGEVLEGQ